MHPRERVAVRRAAAGAARRRSRTRLRRPPGRRAPGSPRRARGTAGVRRSPVERLGVPLDAEHERSPSPSIALDRPVRRPGDGTQPAAEAIDRLVVERVDLPLRRAADAGQPRVRRDLDRRGWSPSPDRSGDAHPVRSGRCWMEAPAARDVERLGAAADAEDRQPGGVGAAGDLELERVEAGLDRAEVRVALGAVRGRVEVRPAGQADAARAAPTQRGDQRRASTGGSTTGTAPARSSARTYGMPSASSCWGGSPSGSGSVRSARRISDVVTPISGGRPVRCHQLRRSLRSAGNSRTGQGRRSSGRAPAAVRQGPKHDARTVFPDDRRLDTRAPPPPASPWCCGPRPSWGSARRARSSGQAR